MSPKLVLEILMQVVGGLGIFLLGMKFMSEGMQAVAGNRLRKMIGAATDNRFLACLVGTAVTCLIQSSSVTTVMVVGFVNGGFMTLLQAIGVILGANVGTTITGWILVLKIGKFGLPILGIAAIFHLFAKSEKVRYAALCIMGIGMVFFGLEIMGKALKDPAVKESLRTIFATMSGNDIWSVLKCATVGCVATFIVQSSSATLGITIALALNGVIDFNTAAGLIVGLNIGTTVTAFLASIGTTTNAKRAAYAHILFNILGTLWLIPAFPYYTRGIVSIVDWVATHTPMEIKSTIGAQIALCHTSFNLINTIIFLPLMGILAKVVTRLVPEKAHKEKPHLTYLDVRMLETPSIGIQQSHIEVKKMGEHNLKMSTMVRELLTTEELDDALVGKVFHREEVLDDIQREVTVFISDLLGGTVTHEVMTEARTQLRIADEFESVSDYYATILKRRLKLQSEGLEFSKAGLADILRLHDLTHDYVELVNVAVEQENREILSKATTQAQAITHQVREARTEHLRRVTEEQVAPYKSLIVTDILQSYRKVTDHVLNIAEALAGEK